MHQRSGLAAFMLLVLFSAGCIAAPPTAPAAPAALTPGSGVTATPLLRSPLAGDANREVLQATVLFAPGATTGRHRHPGDEYAIVVDGAVELLSEGSAPRLIKAGEAYVNLRGVAHETRNPGAVPARVASTFIIDRNKPLIEALP